MSSETSGGFGGLFRPDFSGLPEPVLVASTDGVGTKLKVAIAAGRHDTCGADLVNHCVNDILVQGARPLFFLDYVATGRIEPDVLGEVIEGVARGCRENGTALLGGETAEMPGFYADGRLRRRGDDRRRRRSFEDSRRLAHRRRRHRARAAVGRACTPTATRSRAGCSSTSSARSPGRSREGLGGHDGRRTRFSRRISRICAALEPLLEAGLVHGMAHITGGGFYDNIPRVLPEGLDVVIRAGAWPVPPVFEIIQRKGGVSFEEMHRVFNMGIGMVVFVAAADLAASDSDLERRGAAVVCRRERQGRRKPSRRRRAVAGLNGTPWRSTPVLGLVPMR